LSVAGGLSFHINKAGQAALTVMFAGQEITGGCISLTVTVKLQLE
jgi:hypothetical protein